MKIKLLWLVHRVGPYHHARYQALGELIELVILETRPDSQEYPWEERQEARSYERLSLSFDSNQKPSATKMWKAIHKILDKTKPNRIFTTGWADSEYFFAWLWAKQRRVPVFFACDSTNEDYTRSKWKEYLKGFWVNRFDGALVAGSRSKVYLTTLGWSAQKKTTQPWDVVDNDYFNRTVSAVRDKQDLSIKKKYKLPDNYLICVARFIEKKNHLTVLAALSILVKEASAMVKPIVFIGAGELKNEIQTYIREHKLESYALLYDFIQYDELPHFYAYADALLLPSTSDQWGLVVNEAMAAGLPVSVSKACGCADDLVVEKENGTTFSPDVSGILQTLRYLHTMDESQRHAMGSTSVDIIKNYSLAAFTSGVIELLK